LETLISENFFLRQGYREMTSLIHTTKQIPANAGYYIPIADCRDTVFVNNGTDAAPSFGSMLSTISTAGAAVSTLIQSAGAGVFRDMGKTLISSGRTFRKVQLLVSSTQDTNGVYGASPAYLSGYIALPGSGDGANQGAIFTPVARLG
jgi:hypothetical protein